jgi:small subunit ribosomal protein S18
MEREISQETGEDQPQTGDGDAPAAERGRPPQRRERGEGQDFRPRRPGGGRGRRRPCVMCVEKMPYVDYKDFNFLRRFLSDRGRIDSRRKSGTCAKHQRALALAIKRARHLALLPYTAGHIRSSGIIPSR